MTFTCEEDQLRKDWKGIADMDNERAGGYFHFSSILRQKNEILLHTVDQIVELNN